MDNLRIASTGFPLTNKTLRFLQECFTSPLIALALLTGDKTIMRGVLIDQVNNTVSEGFICVGGEILAFQAGVVSDTVTIVEEIEYVSYNVDGNNDQQLDSLPAYVKRYAKCGTGGVVTFPFGELVRLKSMKELSAFELPENLVQDADYVHTDKNFTQALLDKLNSIADGAEPNVQTDWLEANPASDRFLLNKPTNLLKQFRIGSIQLGDMTASNAGTTVTFPSVGTLNYTVLGSFKSVGTNGWADGSLTFATANHQMTSFHLIVREFENGGQNVRFYYVLIPSY